jgi:hypothetical protein
MTAMGQFFVSLEKLFFESLALAGQFIPLLAIKGVATLAPQIRSSLPFCRFSQE